MPLLFYYLMPLLLAAGLYDFYWRRIPNMITLPMAGVGIVLQTCTGAGFSHALIGLMAGGGFFFLCYLAGIMGAGDVKLMAAVSIWLDIPVIIAALVLTIFCGGLLAVAMLIWHRSKKNRADQDKVANGKLSLPYGVAIAAGSVLSLFIVF